MRRSSRTRALGEASQRSPLPKLRAPSSLSLRLRRSRQPFLHRLPLRPQLLKPTRFCRLPDRLAPHQWRPPRRRVHPHLRTPVRRSAPRLPARPGARLQSDWSRLSPWAPSLEACPVLEPRCGQSRTPPRRRASETPAPPPSRSTTRRASTRSRPWRRRRHRRS